MGLSKICVFSDDGSHLHQCQSHRKRNSGAELKLSLPLTSPTIFSVFSDTTKSTQKKTIVQFWIFTHRYPPLSVAFVDVSDHVNKREHHTFRL